MSEEVRYVEHPSADVSSLAYAVNEMQSQVSDLSQEVVAVNAQVDQVQNRFSELLDEFRAYVVQDMMDRRLQVALEEKVIIKQELEKRFGLHQKVRAYVTGILQAVDTGLVKKETIENCTEELMISVPHYWLAPALVALAAWISDNNELAQKALREAMNRDDEKTCLLFALICRRVSRNQATSVWLQRYLAMQDPMDIERKLIVVLDAYANGLFGPDSKGALAQRLGEWIVEMEDTVGFREAQVTRWEQVIASKIPNDNYESDFPYLKKYAKNWADIKRSLNNSSQHQVMYDYVRGVFEQDNGDVGGLKKQLDELLDSLVTNYDSEEYPVRMRYHFEELVIEAKGDENEANRHFDVEKSAFDEKSDLTQLLTNAAMNPELVHASPATQKLSMSISRDWLIESYNNVTLKNRAETVDEINMEIEGFECASRDGLNEDKMATSAEDYFTRLRDSRVDAVKQSPMDYFIAGAAVLVLILSIASVFPIIIGLAALVLGGLKFYFGMRKVKSDKEKIVEDFTKIISDAKNIVKALCAEIIDLRRTLATKEEQFDPLMEYLNDISPEQFIKNNNQRNIVMN